MAELNRLWMRSAGRFYRRHPWQLGLLLLGVALGVAVVAAVEITNQSARHSLRVAGDQLFGQATHRIVGERGVAENLLGLVETELGILASPTVQGFVRHREAGLLRVLGIDPLRFGQVRPQLSRALVAPEAKRQRQRQPEWRDLWLTEYAVVMEPATASVLGAASDERLSVLAPVGNRTLSLVGVIGSGDEPALRQVLIMDIGWAQELLDQRGQLSHIELKLTDDEANRVARWLPSGLRLETTDQRRAEMQQLSAAFHLNLSALGMLALVVGLFLVYNSQRFLLLQRLPESLLFRSLGVGRRQLRRWQWLELMLLAGGGTMMGLALGLVIARYLLALVTQTHQDLYSALPESSLAVSPFLVFNIILVGVGGSLLAGWMASRAHTSRSILSLQRYSESAGWAGTQLPRQLVLAALLLALALLFALWRDGGVFGGFIAVTGLLLGMALLVPALLAAGSRLGEMVLSRIAKRRFLPLMALRGLRRHLERTGVALMALMVAVAASIGIGLMVASFRDTLEHWLVERLNADLYLSRYQELPGQQLALPAPLLDALGQAPEVQALASLNRVEARVLPNQPVTGADRHLAAPAGRLVELWVASLPPAQRAAYRFRDGDAEQAWDRLLNLGGVLVSEPLANHLRLRRGDSLRLETPAGDQSLIVRGVYYDYGRDSGRLLMTQTQFERFWSPRPVRSLGIYLHQPEQADRLAERIRRDWPELDLRIGLGRELVERSLAVFERTFRVTEVLRWLALGVAFVGMFGALSALLMERGPEARLMRALGLGRGALVGLLMFEAAALGLLAGLIAIPCGQLLSVLLLEVIQLRAFGWSLALVTPWAGVAQALFGAVVAATLAALYPAWKFCRYQRTPREE